MACYHPIPAYQEGSEQPRLWPALGTANLSIPCGSCLGCKTARATMWAHRCDHEARQWESNIFVTLTYEDTHLPPEGHLDADALTRFIKRLRKRVSRDPQRLRSNSEGNVKYFACGEYGEENGRPHYHACLFNIGFDDGYRVGKDLYESGFLSQLWGKGRATFSTFNPARANYVAQYTLKKQGNHSDHDADGVWRPAPFLRVSLKPAIGLTWLAKYKEDLQHGYLVAGGYRQAIPRTYRERLKLQDPGLAEDIDIRTINHRKTLNQGDNNTPERRAAAEQIHKRKKELTENRKL